MLVIKFSYRKDQFWISIKSRTKAVFSAAALSAFAMGVHYVLEQQGLHPGRLHEHQSLKTMLHSQISFLSDWSLEKAMRWCEVRQWLTLDTTPFYALTRYSGAALGLALALTSFNVRQKEVGVDGDLSFGQQTARTALGLLCGAAAWLAHKGLAANAPRVDMRLFYASEYFLNAGLVFAVLSVAPFVARKLTGAAEPAVARSEEKKARKSAGRKAKLH